MRIVLFIESLRSGGKERRFIELLTYLKDKKYEILVILTNNEIHYDIFLSLNIQYIVIERHKLKKDPRLFFSFYTICYKFKPDIVHVWGSMVAFYSLPTVILQKIPLINSQITNATMNRSWISRLVSYINFRISDVVISNSKAGLESYKLSENKKYRVIYNGVNLNRFKFLPTKKSIKKKYRVYTKYAVVMVGSFTYKKDFKLFTEIAETVTKKRTDISFVCVGDGPDYDKIKDRSKNNKNILFTGRINDVEALVASCDVGFLFSPHGEGISNSILEYMALAKPVIANDAGGTRELVIDKKTGFLISDNSVEVIVTKLYYLIDSPSVCKKMGNAGKKRIDDQFNIERMGKEFENLYLT